MLKQNTKCRICKSNDLYKFLDLGNMPLAGGFLNKKDFDKEFFFPLRVYFCRKCTLVQIVDVVPPDILFKHYFYLSSVTLSNHFEQYAKEIIQKFKLLPNSFIVEIGSNDGVLLKPFTEQKMKTLGVDPAINISKIAESKGIKIIKKYFTENAAIDIAKTEGKADIICANNVFAHIDNIFDVIKGIKVLLKEDGIFIFEVHYIVDLLKEMQYDTIYHEHLCYYSLKALSILFKQFDMELFDVKRINIHSGSIRGYAANIGKRNKFKTEMVNKLFNIETQMGLDNTKTYFEISKNVKKHKEKLNILLKQLKKQGKKIVGYGAPGRGNTLLNYCKINTELLDYVIDESPQRYNKYIPGMHIPILPPEELKKTIPDYALMLAWSYADNILKKESEYLKNGGKFIMPLSLKIYDQNTPKQ